MPAQPKSTTGPRVLTVRELAGYLRVHRATVYRLAVTNSGLRHASARVSL
jgi:hypothetical protein